MVVAGEVVYLLLIIYAYHHKKYLGWFLELIFSMAFRILNISQSCCSIIALLLQELVSEKDSSFCLCSSVG